MLTMLSLLKRHEDATAAEFFDWYARHADAATHIPGLRRYVVNTVTEDGQPYDAVSELTFDDLDSMQAGLASPPGERSRTDTHAHVSARTVLHVAQRELILPPGT